jgi:hypothetical protein
MSGIWNLLVAFLLQEGGRSSFDQTEPDGAAFGPHFAGIGEK